RRISNNHIKPTSFHNAIELHPPVEWLVALLPLRKSGIILRFMGKATVLNAVLRGQIAIQLCTQRSQHASKLLFVGRHIARIKNQCCLEFAEMLEGALDLL